VKPSPGPYRLSTPNPSGGALVVDLDITAAGAVGPHGEPYLWLTIEGEDVLVSQTRVLTLEFLVGGQGLAVHQTPPTPTPFAWGPRP
jgi:hypothetical protein